MKQIFIFLIICLACYLAYKCGSTENFNISNVSPGAPISNQNFSKMFENIPLPASDELAEMGGKFAQYEGIESPQLYEDSPYSQVYHQDYDPKAYIGVD